MHRTSDVDVKFDVVFEGLEGLPQSSSLFFVSWSISRGLKQARSGESKKVVVDAKGEPRHASDGSIVDPCAFFSFLFFPSLRANVSPDALRQATRRSDISSA